MKNLFFDSCEKGRKIIGFNCGEERTLVVHNNRKVTGSEDHIFVTKSPAIVLILNMNNFYVKIVEVIASANGKKPYVNHLFADVIPFDDRVELEKFFETRNEEPVGHYIKHLLQLFKLSGGKLSVKPRVKKKKTVSSEKITAFVEKFNFRHSIRSESQAPFIALR